MNIRKIKPKHYINYVLVLAFLIPFAVLGLTGSVKGSTSDLLIKIAYSMILAVSLNLVVGFLGELSLGHAGFMCVGAYLGGFFGNALLPMIGNKLVVLIISMLIGGVIAALFGLLIGLPTLRLKGDYLAIVTLAFGEIVRTIFRNQDAFGGAMGLPTQKYGRNLFIIGFVMVLFTILVSQNLMRSKHGRAIQAIRDNEIAARAMGVNITYYKLVVFVVAAFFAGVAGVLFANNTTLITSSFFSFNYSIEILVMVVMGGMGNITGSLIAAGLLTFIDIKLTTTLSGDLAALKYLIYALILIVMVMWNNAPALRRIRERYNLGRLFAWIKSKIVKKSNEDDTTNLGTVAWDKVPTKIPMDAILSTDFKPDHNFEADKPEKGDK